MSLSKKVFIGLAAVGTVGGIPFAVFVVLIPGVILSGSSFIGLVAVTSKEVFKHLKRNNKKNKKPLQAPEISKSKLIVNQSLNQRH